MTQPATTAAGVVVTRLTALQTKHCGALLCGIAFKLGKA
jgi:hypothetical protein